MGMHGPAGTERPGEGGIYCRECLFLAILPTDQTGEHHYKYNARSIYGCIV